MKYNNEWQLSRCHVVLQNFPVVTTYLFEFFEPKREPIMYSKNKLRSIRA